MKKIVSALMIGTLAVGSLVGCSNNGAEAADKKDQVLRFATWNTGENLVADQAWADEFTAQTGIKVQVEPYGDGFDQKLAASFGAKNPPDVMLMWNFPHYYASLEPLDDYIAADKSLEVEDIYEGMFNYLKIEDKTYGMPFGFTTHAMYYNKDLFDAAGVPYPESGWTWDDFLDKAAKLSKPDEKQYGYVMGASYDPYDFQQFIWSNGSSFVSDDGMTIEGYMNGPESVEVVKMFQDMFKSKAGILVGSKDQQGPDDIFKASKSAMVATGIWPFKGFEEAGINFGTVEMPVFEGKEGAGICSVGAIAVSKDSKNKEAAWEFVKFACSPEQIEKRKADLPVRASVEEKTGVAQDEKIKPFFQMKDKLKQVPAFMLNKNWAEVQKNLSVALESSYLGEEDPQVALDKAVSASTRFLQQ